MIHMERNVRTRWLVGFGLVVAGGLAQGCYNLPEPRVTQQAVFQAAKEVIEAKYPQGQAAASPEGGFVVAVTPTQLDGSSKTKKQISVIAQRNYTGNFEPVVRVRQLIEVDEPFRSNPESADLSDAAPLAVNKWQPLGYLPYEEQDLTSAILKKLEPRGM